MAGSLEVLYVTYGLCVGFGINLILSADCTIIPQYFNKKLPLASGIALSGVALGQLVFAPVDEFLVNKYGLNGAFLVLAAITLHAIPLGKDSMYQSPMPITGDQCGVLSL